MSAPRSIRALCRRHRNEDPHSEQVAGLALALFDGVRAALRFTREDRRCLELAAWLHDIGYAAGPEGHAHRGARIVLEESPAAVSPARKARIAAMVLLHGGNPASLTGCGSPGRFALPTETRVGRGIPAEPGTQGWKSGSPGRFALPVEPPLDLGNNSLRADPIVAGLPDPMRALQLAAILRVADGLDHGHIQDVRIRGIEVTAGRVDVTVTGVYAGNAPWARARADLWSDVIFLPLTLKSRVARTARPFEGVVRRRDDALNAARRILAFEFRLMDDGRPGAFAGEDPEQLHALRVAIRRFRNALRFFRGPLGATPAAQLDEELQALCRSLGPARDADAFVEWLQSKRLQREFGAEPGWTDFLDFHKERVRAEHGTVRAVLEGEPYRQLMSSVRMFLRVDLCDELRRRPPEPHRDYAAPRLRKDYRRILRHNPVEYRADTEALHDFRRLCRRLRYRCESVAPAFGEAITALASRLKDVADALGDYHDMDVARDRALHSATPPPARFDAWLQQRQRRHWKEFEGAWSRLGRRKFRKESLAAFA